MPFMSFIKLDLFVVHSLHPRYNECKSTSNRLFGYNGWPCRPPTLWLVANTSSWYLWNLICVCYLVVFICGAFVISQIQSILLCHHLFSYNTSSYIVVGPPIECTYFGRSDQFWSRYRALFCYEERHNVSSARSGYVLKALMGMFKSFSTCDIRVSWFP